MNTVKNDILKLIPRSKVELRSSIQASPGTKRSLGTILVNSFGFNTSLWEQWQTDIVAVFSSSPDTDFAAPDSNNIDDIKEWLMQAIDQRFDTDGRYGSQCKDFANAYSQWLGHPLKPSDAAATWDIEQESFWQKVPHSTDIIPQTGDIAIWAPWENNQYGHIAVVLEAQKKSFRSVDQNWENSDSSKGSPAAIIEHSYTEPQVIGYLRPTLQ